jgi:hypothetical protein
LKFAGTTKRQSPRVEKLVVDIGLHSAVVEGLTFDDQRVMRIEESGVCIVCSENELICLQLSQC